jgi:dihydrofolate reductase
VGEFEPPTQLTGTNIGDQIKELKDGDGGDIIAFGSLTLVQSLTNAGLVDEYRILIHPVIVNEGKRLFENLDGRTNFRLISVDMFERGAILVKYSPIGLTGTIEIAPPNNSFKPKPLRGAA